MCAALLIWERERAELNRCNECRWGSKTDVTAAEKGKEEGRKENGERTKRQRGNGGKRMKEGVREKNKGRKLVKGGGEGKRWKAQQIGFNHSRSSTLSHGPPSIIKTCLTSWGVIWCSCVHNQQQSQSISGLLDARSSTLTLHHMFTRRHRLEHHLRQNVSALHKSIWCGLAIFSSAVEGSTVCGHTVDDAHKKW